MHQQQLRPLPTPEKLESLKNLTHVLYALYAFVWFSGLPFVVAIIINYIKREETIGTLYESHFRWQIQTFWYTLIFGLVGVPLIFIGVGVIIIGALAIWYIYRIAKGWLYLKDGRPVGDPIPTLY